MTNTPIDISIPHRCNSEIRWTCRVIFEHLLGINITFTEIDTKDVIFNRSNKYIRIKNVFFENAEDHWLKKNTLPNQTRSTWNSQELGLAQNLLDPILPVILGASEATRNSKGNLAFEDGIEWGDPTYVP